MNGITNDLLEPISSTYYGLCSKQIMIKYHSLVFYLKVPFLKPIFWIYPFSNASFISSAPFVLSWLVERGYFFKICFLLKPPLLPAWSEKKFFLLLLEYALLVKVYDRLLPNLSSDRVNFLQIDKSKPNHQESRVGSLY